MTDVILAQEFSSQCVSGLQVCLTVVCTKEVADCCNKTVFDVQTVGSVSLLTLINKIFL